MENSSIALYVASFSTVISVVGHLSNWLSLRQKANVDRVAELEKHIEKCEEDHEWCEQDRKRLHEENLELMKKLILGKV